MDQISNETNKYEILKPFAFGNYKKTFTYNKY